jgi:transcriptional regulator with XRE-family HTH domain
VPDLYTDKIPTNVAFISRGMRGIFADVAKDKYGVITGVGNRIRYVRETVRDMSRDVLAEETGLSSASIMNYESGLRDPKTKDLAKIAEVLGTTVAYFHGEIDDYSPGALKKPEGREMFRLHTNRPVTTEEVDLVYQRLSLLEEEARNIAERKKAFDELEKKDRERRESDASS